MHVADTCLFPVWQVHLPAYTLWQYDQCPVMEPSKPPDHYNILHLSHKSLCISMILAVCGPFVKPAGERSRDTGSYCDTALFISMYGITMHNNGNYFITIGHQL